MTRFSPRRHPLALLVAAPLLAALLTVFAAPGRSLSQQQKPTQQGPGGGADAPKSDGKPWEDETTKAALEGRDPDPKKVEAEKQAAAAKAAAAGATAPGAKPTAKGPGDGPKPWEDEATKAALEGREPDSKTVDAQKAAASEKAAPEKGTTPGDGTSDKPPSPDKPAATPDKPSAGDDRGAATPSSKPAAKANTPELVNRALDQMVRTYEKRMDTQDWVSRALSTISLARIPRADIVKRMLDIAEQDKHPVVKLLAWQSVLARAGELTPEQYDRWMKVTLAMAEKGSFNGPLRVDLLKLMATAPPSASAKRVFGLVFDSCNAWEPQDIPTLDALANTLKSWRSYSLATALVKKLTDPDAGVRAEYVLKKAGYNGKDAVALIGPTAMDPIAQKRVHPKSADLWIAVQNEAAGWLTKIRPEWKGDSLASAPASTATASTDDAAAGAAAGSQPWRQLTPRYVPPPPTLDSVDLNDPVWKTDLELGRVNLTEFEVVFVVDATGTMTEVIAWLRRDVGNMMRALAQVSSKPRLGITFYRDKGPYQFVTKNLPLTSQVQALMPDLNAITADGGGDIPEAVLDGLRDALTKNKWTSKNAKAGSRVVIIVGDAPPHPQDIPACVKMAGDWARDGYRFHCGKVRSVDVNNDLASFDEIAKAGRGDSVDLEFPNLSLTKIVDKAGKPIPPQSIARPEMQLLIAPPPPKDEQPGAALLARVLGNAMNPQYQNRMDPLTKTLLAFCEQREKEKRLGFPPNTPSLNAAIMKKQ